MMVTKKIGVNLFNYCCLMKKIFSSVIVIAAAALTFFACTKQENDANLPTSKTVKFIAESIATKTVFGTPTGTTYPTLWTATTKVKVACNYSGGVDSEVTPSTDGTTASFDSSVKIPDAGPYKFMALSPATAYVGLSGADYYSWNVNIPTAQKPISGSVDESAQILSALSAEFTDAPETVSLNFNHVTAYGHFSIKNLALGTATVESVSVTSSVPFAGRFYYYLEGTKAGSVAANSASATISLVTASVDDLWFACAPVDLSGATLTIVVATSEGTFTKAVTCPASAQLASGKIFKFSVDFAGVAAASSKIYTLVTDASDITPGSEVIIANTSAKMAMSTTQNNNNRGIAAVTIESNKISNPADGVQIFVVEDGTATGSVSFKCVNGDKADNYIFAASSSGNYLRSQATNDANSSWTVTIAANGDATMVAQGTNTRNHIRYNAGSSCFSAYAETSSISALPAIYKREGTGSTPVTKTPLDKPTNVTATLSASAVNAIDVSWDAVTGAASYRLTAMPTGTAAAKTANTGSTTYTFTDLDYSTAYTISVVALPADTDNYKDSDAAEASPVTTGAKPSTGTEKTATLSGTNMAAMSDAGTGYNTVKSVTVDGWTWSTNGYQTADLKNMIQLRSRTNSKGVSYIKLPEFTGNIISIEFTCTASGANSATGDAPNTTLAFQEGTTSSESTIITTAAAANSVTMDFSGKSYKTGYITVSGSTAIRIWNIEVTYE